jgi:dTDP-glucose 4,6-dehydratase
MLCALYADRYGIEPTIARCFAFIGPYLPIDAHFAAGNFIRDALAGGPINVTGDGSPLRSYLYSGDLAIWLWTILLRGQGLHPYNVGSSAALSVAELADVVARTVAPAVSVHRAKLPRAGVPAERYVPSVTRAEKELGLQARISVEEAIRRTVSWHEHRKSPVGADN